jgi:type IV secretion system protein VirB11
VVAVPRRLIAEAIDVVAFISGRGASRRLDTLVGVAGLDAAGDYLTVSLDPKLLSASEGETPCACSV